MSRVGIAVQISKFIPLLASDKSGEVIAAVNAMDRALRRDGRDFHDLAAAVERGWSVPARRESQGLPPWQRRARELLSLGVTSMRACEREFLQSMAIWPSPPSEKQKRWLSAIAAAMGVAA